MILISIMASVVNLSYPNSALINFAVYYRVYPLGGKAEEKAKTSFDESDISLGRIIASTPSSSLPLTPLGL